MRSFHSTQETPVCFALITGRKNALDGVTCMARAPPSSPPPDSWGRVSHLRRTDGGKTQVWESGGLESSSDSATLGTASSLRLHFTHPLNGNVGQGGLPGPLPLCAASGRILAWEESSLSIKHSLSFFSSAMAFFSDVSGK